MDHSFRICLHDLLSYSKKTISESQSNPIPLCHNPTSSSPPIQSLLLPLCPINLHIHPHRKQPFSWCIKSTLNEDVLT